LKDQKYINLFKGKKIISTILFKTLTGKRTTINTKSTEKQEKRTEGNRTTTKAVGID